MDEFLGHSLDRLAEDYCQRIQGGDSGVGLTSYGTVIGLVH